MQIKPAQKFKQFARVCFWGCPKQGKTYGAMAIATAMVGPHGKVGVISSEYGSSNLLSRKFPHDIIDLTVDDHGNPIANPFAPTRYEEALRLFVENSYDAIVIDSLSHAWEGEGGILEQVKMVEGNNKFTDGWGKVGTPSYQHLIKSILSTKAHIFITIRAKDGYVLEPGKDGKMTPRNVGLKPVIRSSFGYEMQLTIRMDALIGHIEESAFQNDFPQGTQIVRPGEDVASTLLACLDGDPVPEPSHAQMQMRKLLDDLYALAPHVYAKYAQWEEMALRAALGIKEGPLPTEYTDEHIRLMQDYVEKKRPRKAQCQAESDASLPSVDTAVSHPADSTNGMSHDTPTKPEKPVTKPIVASPASSPAQEPSLDSLIKQAKLRASSLGLARDAAEWASLLKSCKIAEIKSTADLAVIIEHMDQFEREQQAVPETPEVGPPPVLATPQQIASIQKLCSCMGRSVPEADGMTDAAARTTIKELTAAYKEFRKAIPVR